MPTNLPEWGTLIALLAVLLAVLRVYFRLEGALPRVDGLEKWREQIKVGSKEELDRAYAGRDVVELQFKELRASNERVEQLVKDTKADLRESMHALRNDLITLFKNLPLTTRPRSESE